MKTLFSISICLLTAHLASAQSSMDSLASMQKPESLLVCPRIPAVEPDEEITIRSCRSGSTYYYIDGIKVRASSADTNSLEIEEITVITGGIPGDYGDLNGGIIQVAEKAEVKN